MRIALLALALVLLSAEAAEGAWRRPVPGAVARAFAYSPSAPFRAGAHRGVDLAAPPGARVRAACSGEVVTAAMGVVTLRCGRWRVTALPLAADAVRVGARVRAGATIGRVGTMTGHTGLHLGVRRASDRFAYVDPLPLLTAEPSPPAGAPWRGPRPRRRRGPRPRRASPRRRRAHCARAAASPRRRRGSAPAPRVAVPSPRAAPASRVRVSSRASAGRLAPWPAWVGLGLLALGAVGGGVRIRVRRARARAGVPVPSAP